MMIAPHQETKQLRRLQINHPHPPLPHSTPNQQPNLREPIKIAVEHNKSGSKTEWQRQKDQENASNPAIDEIMDMIGLENVKIQVLRIKAKVDTSIRQGIDLKKERLGLVLLGNPGTGTVLVHSEEEVTDASQAKLQLRDTTRRS